MTALLEALLVLAVWVGASTAVLSGIANLSAAGAAFAAAAAGALLFLHGELTAGALLGAIGVALALWFRPAAGRRALLLPPGSAPVLTLCVVIGALSVWIGGAVLAGPGGSPTRTAALVLVGLGTSRLVAGSEPGRLNQAALLLALGLGLAAAVEPVTISFRAPVIGAAVAAVVAAALTFAGRPAQRGSAWFWAPAIAGLVVVSLAPSLAVLGLVPLLLAVAHVRVEGSARGVRSAALAAGLLGLAALAIAPAGGDKIERLAAVAAALAVAAAAGVLPHLMEVDDSDGGRAAFLRRALPAPALALAVIARAEPALGASPVRVLGAMLLGLGVLNVVVGLAAGLAEDRLQAWRAGYLAEWGLVFISLGLLNTAGAAAAYLLLLGLLLLKLPAGAWLTSAPEVLKGGRARGVVLGLAFAGAPPFAGFAARILLLRGATALAWPLALGVGLALAASLPAAWRLGGAVRRPPGRFVDLAQLAGLAVTAAIGVYPAAVLRPVGLG